MSLITEELIDLTQSCVSKQEVFTAIARLAFKNQRILDEASIVAGLFQRENQVSTGLIDGFAIPHTQNAAVRLPTVVILRSNQKLEWETLDESQVCFVLAILLPEEAESNLHLKILSALSKQLMNESFREQLLTAQSSQECLTLLSALVN